MIRALALPFILLGAVACSDSRPPLEIDATGGVAVQAFLDRNGNDLLEQTDLAAAGLKVALLRASHDTVATVLTDEHGIARFLTVPVGSYSLTVSPSALGDSLRVVAIDSTRFTVTATVAPLVRITLGYPLITASQLADFPAGRLATFEGIALHPSNVFGDSTLNAADSTGNARVSGIPARITATTGDSVRVIGRAGTIAGRPALVDAAVYVLAHATAPEPVELTAAAAASAQAGALDGALVRVIDARVVDVANIPGGGVRVRVTDASGPLDIVFARTTPIDLDDPLLPGVTLSTTGILVPRAGTNRWDLKPRGTADVTLIIPSATTAGIRKLAPGTVVSLNGVALNSLAAFGDKTVHVADASGAIRVVNVASSFLLVGDSVRVLAVVGANSGQTVLESVAVTVLGPGTLPEPVLLRTGVAATADDGYLDAALVRVEDALVVLAGATQGSGKVEVVDDGSGRVLVPVNADQFGEVIKNGDRFDVVGVLVPMSTTSWGIRPRSRADLIRVP
jgi:hypothetical protein